MTLALIKIWKNPRAKGYIQINNNTHMYNHMVSFAYLQQQKTVHHHRVRPSCAGALAPRVSEVQVSHVCSLWNQADKRLQQWWWSLIWFQEIRDSPSKASLLRKWLRLKSLCVSITTPCFQPQEISKCEETWRKNIWTTIWKKKYLGHIRICKTYWKSILVVANMMETYETFSHHPVRWWHCTTHS